MVSGAIQEDYDVVGSSLPRDSRTGVARGDHLIKSMVVYVLLGMRVHFNRFERGMKTRLALCYVSLVYLTVSPNLVPEAFCSHSHP